MSFRIACRRLRVSMRAPICDVLSCSNAMSRCSQPMCVWRSPSASTAARLSARFVASLKGTSSDTARLAFDWFGPKLLAHVGICDVLRAQHRVHCALRVAEQRKKQVPRCRVDAGAAQCGDFVSRGETSASNLELRCRASQPVIDAHVWFDVIEPLRCREERGRWSHAGTLRNAGLN